ncbi:MAG: ABC transporter ATP-binding protein [Defluviicoccus sp.]
MTAVRSIHTADAASLAVRCRGLTKSFTGAAATVHALRGIELDVPRGGMTMLVGPSGCGKTTLISVIAGILTPDGGECVVLGTELSTLHGRQLLDFRGRSIGFIFQQFHLVPTLTVIENAAIPLIINGTPGPRARAAAAEIIAEVGLGDRGRELPGVLSGGEQQRVAIARALVHGPALVVCDEPTSALDHESGRKIMALLRRFVSQRCATILIVTHDSRIFPFADRIARMDDGRIVGIETEVTTGETPGERPGERQ